MIWCLLPFHVFTKQACNALDKCPFFYLDSLHKDMDMHMGNLYAKYDNTTCFSPYVILSTTTPNHIFRFSTASIRHSVLMLKVINHQKIKANLPVYWEHKLAYVRISRRGKIYLREWFTAQILLGEEPAWHLKDTHPSTEYDSFLIS